MRLYSLVGWILYYFSKIEGEKKVNQVRILYLSKPVFNEDVRALKNFSIKSLYIRFPKVLLYPILKHFISNADELNDMNYHVKVGETSEVKALRNFWKKVIPILQKKLKFDAILSGNFVYTSQQEFFRVANQKNIPIFILYKEGMFPSDRNDHIKKVFYTTKKFFGEKILFYNEGIRKLILNSRLEGINAANTEVVGIPRFDYVFNKKINSVSKLIKKKIVLFSFDPTAKSEYLLEDNTNKLSFEYKLEEFQKNIISFCKENQEYELLIKSKTVPQEITFLKKMLEDLGIRDAHSNIKIVKSETIASTIKDCSYVAGYSSTTLIEGMLQKKTIVCPDVKAFFNNKSPDLFNNNELGICYVKSINELYDTFLFQNNIKNNVDPKIVDENRKSFFEQMLFKADGNSSLRVENIIYESFEKR